MTSELELEKTFRIYVRREGSHLVGLCAEVRAIVAGSTVDEIVERTKALIACAKHARGSATRIAVHISEADLSA